jgi:hypothetical protein
LVLTQKKKSESRNGRLDTAAAPLAETSSVSAQLRLLLNPPCSVAAFVVNSEPHTGARPSVRVCVGLTRILSSKGRLSYINPFCPSASPSSQTSVAALDTSLLLPPTPALRRHPLPEEPPLVVFAPRVVSRLDTKTKGALGVFGCEMGLQLQREARLIYEKYFEALITCSYALSSCHSAW